MRANYLFAGAADLYAENRRREVARGARADLEQRRPRKDVHHRGLRGALRRRVAGRLGRSIAHHAAIHQAYGRNYQLPNVTAHNETCAAIGNVLWNWRMFLVTGEARYVDVLELALYNAVLAA